MMTYFKLLVVAFLVPIATAKRVSLTRDESFSVIGEGYGKLRRNEWKRLEFTREEVSSYDILLQSFKGDADIYVGIDREPTEVEDGYDCASIGTEPSVLDRCVLNNVKSHSKVYVAIRGSPTSDKGHIKYAWIVATKKEKITFQKFGSKGGARKASYPLSKDDAGWLRKSTSAISVMHPRDCIACLKDDVVMKETILNNVLGGLPSFPSPGPTDTVTGLYWDQLREVIRYQKVRRQGQNPEELIPMPIEWQGFDIHAVAEAVHDELPGIWHSQMITDFLKQGLKFDRETVPSLGTVDFLRGEVMLSALNGVVFQAVGPTNFQVKWHVGRPRPEEIAWKISQGYLTSQNYVVPADILADIASMNLQSQFDFTAYAEGSPAHPSWPAMHSAGSSASLWIAVVADLTPEQLCQARRLDYAIAFARTVAGVHYPDDNIAGLNLGNHLVGEFLPGYLATTYNADPEAVARKISAVLDGHDWANFVNTECGKKRG